VTPGPDRRGRASSAHERRETLDAPGEVECRIDKREGFGAVLTPHETVAWLQKRGQVDGLWVQPYGGTALPLCRDLVDAAVRREVGWALLVERSDAFGGLGARREQLEAGIGIWPIETKCSVSVFSDDFSTLRDVGDSERISSAHLRTSAVSWSCGTTALTRPQDSAV